MAEQRSRYDSKGFSGKAKGNGRRRTTVLIPSSAAIAAAAQRSPLESPKANNRTVHKSFMDEMPGPEKLQISLKRRVSQKKQQMITQLSNEDNKLEGMLSVNDVANHFKEQRKNEVS